MREISLLEGLATTRAIRRYTADPIPDEDLASILWHAGRAPSGSNRQPFRFLVLRDGPNAVAARRCSALRSAQGWNAKRLADGYRPSTLRRLDAALRGQFRAGSRGRTGLPRAISAHRLPTRVRRCIRRVRTCCSPPELSATAERSRCGTTGSKPNSRDLLDIPDTRRVVGVHHARCARRPPRPAETQAARRHHVRRRMGHGPDLGLTSAPWLSSPGSTRPPSRPRSRSETSPRVVSSDGDRRRTRR